jgi:L-threonylcarbamoyladenylate synthase
VKKTLVFKVDPDKPAGKIIARAARALRGGKLVAFPTETVYGLGANALKEESVVRLYGVKKRPRAKPFAVLVPGVQFIKRSGCKISPAVRRLAGRFWPGPLTMILRDARGVKTGFRVPDNKVALALMKEAGVPVAAPSANLSGRPAPVDAPGVLAGLCGKIDIVIDGGRAKVGVESTEIGRAHV